ncbi:Immunity protein 22 [Chryseobacterium taichungense]|uniref:Immunity protein 22 n=1 Tax=Chryseobacterium taichungense TaxID=295069 RepID=A0A1H7YSP3_9FLAO|nr:immunity 22 family protein [Chryseobacterium taichungense]SEM48199.1 Immunity protein 22 [Chryseobacterium taichungense]
MNTDTLDFWVGNFNSEEDFYDFVEEDENYYLLEESDDIHISKFAESQDTVWLDHDFVEYGFEGGSRTIYEKFAEYSFAEQWLPILVNRLNEINLKFEVNAIIFLNKGQVPKPVSVENDFFSLTYVGGIEFSA